MTDCLIHCLTDLINIDWQLATLTYGHCIGEVISIDMSEFPVDVICAVLTFCYTTEIEITNETVGPLLKCADELGICVIVGMCVDYLSNVSIETAIMFYSIAENYDLCELKECIYKFIIDNFSEVITTLA